MMESMAPTELQAVTSTSTSTSNMTSNENNLLEALEQKEKDLTLAAELGKALLEKNEDLTRENHELSMEFAAKIEVGKE